MRVLLALLTLIFCSTLSLPMTFAKNSDTQYVLVTGFYDWRDLGTPPQQTRCRDNPSCRILAKEGIGAREYLGPLANLLKDWNKSQKPKVQLEFALLPVTWEALGNIPRERYQTIIHLGLGVYDSFHRILIEDGAYNFRKGKDAIGVSHKEEIEVKAPVVLQAPLQVAQGIQRALKAQLPKPFHLVKASARKDNVYLCNSTYYEALKSLAQDKNKAQQFKKEAYFIHIPHREGKSDMTLSTAVFEIIKALLDH